MKNSIYLPNILFNQKDNFTRKIDLEHENTRHFKQALPFNYEDQIKLLIPSKYSCSKSFNDSKSFEYYKNNPYNGRKSIYLKEENMSNYNNFLKNSENFNLCYKPKKRKKPIFLIKDNSFFFKKKKDYHQIKGLFEQLAFGDDSVIINESKKNNKRLI